ncbi:hypothetical protein [Streptomyces sp. KL116D]|uniref:hypothetical protein n=1 Tax=Streptomyces sp. KL116D TaxID=3045152 RepID=UPI0035586BD0
MASVVVVHGIAQQYLGGRTLHTAVAPALLDGLDLAGGPPLTEKDVDVAFYGHWFRPPGATTKSADRSWTHRDVAEGFETDLLMALWAEAARSHPGRVPAPDPGESHKAVTPRTVQRALYALSKLLPPRFTDRFLVGVLKQVRLYLTDDGVRERVQECVARCVTDDTRVVVGHSLGSVVAYEALAANPAWNVRTLVTLGSPLGLPRLVFDRLRPGPVDGRGSWPGTVRSWTNVCDRGDVVALAERLGPLFGDPPGDGRRTVTDVLVDNGWNAHDIVRHLTAVQTGSAVAEGLRP